MKGNSAPATQQYNISFTNIIKKDMIPNSIQIHFLNVAMIHKQVLNYSKIITNGVQRL